MRSVRLRRLVDAARASSAGVPITTCCSLGFQLPGRCCYRSSSCPLAAACMRVSSSPDCSGIAAMAVQVHGLACDEGRWRVSARVNGTHTFLGLPKTQRSPTSSSSVPPALWKGVVLRWGLRRAFVACVIVGESKLGCFVARASRRDRCGQHDPFALWGQSLGDSRCGRQCLQGHVAPHRCRKGGTPQHQATLGARRRSESGARRQRFRHSDTQWGSQH